MAVQTINPEEIVKNSKSRFFFILLYTDKNEVLSWHYQGGFFNIEMSKVEQKGMIPFRKEEAVDQYYAASRKCRNDQREGSLQLLEVPSMPSQ